jgi:hypothetical protein
MAKLLNRNLILPKFHCYIGQPASCLLDAIFDPVLTREIDVYENAFLQSPNVPSDHLRRATLSLPDFDSAVKIGTMKDLLFQLQGFTAVPLLVLEFPKMAKDGKHYSLNSISDRYENGTEKGILTVSYRRARWDHDLFVNQVEKSVKFSGEVLGNWTNFLPSYIRDEGADFACVLTVAEKLEFLVSNLKV